MKIFLKVIVFLFFSVLSCKLCSANVFFIRKEAEVKTDKIYFKDIAYVGEKNRIGEVEIGKSAFPGKYRKLSKYHILSKLKQAGYNVELEGEENISVLTCYSTITPDQITSTLQEYFKNIPNLTVEYLQPFKEITAPCGDVMLNVGTLQNNRIVAIDILIDRKIYKTYKIPVRIKETKVAFFPKRNIKRGEVLSESDFEKKPALSSLLPKDVVIDISFIENSIAKENIFTSSPLRQIHLAEKLACRKNDIVSIVGKLGVLEVKAQGKALQDGKIGNIIKVLTGSRQEIFAKVVGERIVEIDFKEE